MNIIGVLLIDFIYHYLIYNLNIIHLFILFFSNVFYYYIFLIAPQTQVEYLGNVTECAMLLFIKEIERIDYMDIRKWKGGLLIEEILL